MSKHRLVLVLQLSATGNCVAMPKTRTKRLNQDERLYTQIEAQQDVLLRSTSQMLDLVDHLREECGRKERKLREQITMRNIERGCKASLQVWRWESLILKQNLLNWVRLYHRKKTRSLKARCNFKNTVEIMLQAGIPPSDWTLADFVDASDSE